MRAISNSRKFAQKVGVPQKVGKEFEAADQKKAKHERMYKKKEV